MKKVLFAMFFASLVNMAACQNAVNNKGSIKQTIPVAEFEAKLGNAQLIDVRTPGEYAGGHLKDAVNIDYNGNEFENRIAQLDKNKPVLVYCLSGGRSSRAAAVLQDMGFKEVYNLDGGIMKWNSAGKPLDKGGVNKENPGISATEFAKLTILKKYVLIDYNANWCEPCKKMLPVLERLAGQRNDSLHLVKIDADTNKQLMKDKGISSIPYLELYKNGALVWKHEGYIEEDELLKETGL